MPELHRLGLLVLGHRGKLRKLDVDFDDVTFVKQLLTLRIATVLCHARRNPVLQGVSMACDSEISKQFVLTVEANWVNSFPQSMHLLREEQLAWKKTPWDLHLTLV